MSRNVNKNIIFGKYHNMSHKILYLLFISCIRKLDAERNATKYNLKNIIIGKLNVRKEILRISQKCYTF